MHNNKTPDSSKAAPTATTPDQPKKQLTEYELISAAIKIPDNHLQLLAARVFYFVVSFAVPFWFMGHWR